MTEGGDAEYAPARGACGRPERRLLLVALALFGVNLSCNSAAVRREQPWFLEGVNARWRYYADTLPMVAAQRLEEGDPSVSRNAAVHTMLGILCFYDLGSEYLDKTELDDSVVVRAYRAARTDEARRRLHRAYRSGRKLSSRLWWRVYDAVLQDDSSSLWTRAHAESLWKAGNGLDTRMNPPGDTTDPRVKRLIDAFKAELWKEYLKERK